MNTKAIAAFLMANVFLYSALAVTLYNFYNLATMGALIPQSTYTLIGVIAVVCVVFSYLTKIIIEKV